MYMDSRIIIINLNNEYLKSPEVSLIRKGQLPKLLSIVNLWAFLFILGDSNGKKIFRNKFMDTK